ncbi:Eukaryotic aspartyl protease family protein [Zea mays]|uniref:Eukaryotic aspartyl protease family protein n=1 Tax=Zea mays TaxID=4577 RepID=A0A1D6H816_MAIZE|nr:Eukaryotic aspartyl protease family protein [Zea mays]
MTPTATAGSLAPSTWPSAASGSPQIPAQPVLHPDRDRLAAQGLLRAGGHRQRYPLGQLHPLRWLPHQKRTWDRADAVRSGWERDHGGVRAGVLRCQQRGRRAPHVPLDVVAVPVQDHLRRWEHNHRLLRHRLRAVQPGVRQRPDHHVQCQHHLWVWCSAWWGFGILEPGP